MATMALTFMPGCTVTDRFGLAPEAVTRVAAVPGVIAHTAWTCIPGCICTTAFGGKREVGGRGVLKASPQSGGSMTAEGAG